MLKGSGKIKKNERGLSIIEIVVAMVLLMVAMMSLAFVYPKGRTLTDSSRLSMQATEIARSIMEEIKIRPIESRLQFGAADVSQLGLISSNTSIMSLQNPSFNYAQMSNYMWPFHHFASNLQQWQSRTPVYCWEETPNDLTSNAALSAFKTK